MEPLQAPANKWRKISVLRIFSFFFFFFLFFLSSSLSCVVPFLSHLHALCMSVVYFHSPFFLSLFLPFSFSPPVDFFRNERVWKMRWLILLFLVFLKKKSQRWRRRRRVAKRQVFSLVCVHVTNIGRNPFFLFFLALWLAAFFLSFFRFLPSFLSFALWKQVVCICYLFLLSLTFASFLFKGEVREEEEKEREENPFSRLLFSSLLSFSFIFFLSLSPPVPHLSSSMLSLLSLDTFRLLFLTIRAERRLDEDN